MKVGNYNPGFRRVFMSCRCPVNVRKFVLVFSDLYEINYILWRCNLVRVYTKSGNYGSHGKSLFLLEFIENSRKSLSFGKLVKCFFSNLKKSWNVEILILCFKRVS